MALEHERKRVNNLIMDSTLLLCKSGLSYTSQLKVQGVIGLTVDGHDFLVHLNESYEKNSPSADSTSAVEESRKPVSREKERIREREKRLRDKPTGRPKDEVVDLTAIVIEPITEEQQKIRAAEKVLVKSIIMETVGLVCNHSLTYTKKVTIAAVIGVTVDTDVFLVHVTQDLKKADDSEKIDDSECVIIDADSSDQPQLSKEPCKGSQQQKTKEKHRNRPKDEQFVDLTETIEEPEPSSQRQPRKTVLSSFTPQPRKTVSSSFSFEPRKRVRSAFSPQPFRPVPSAFSPQPYKRVSSSFSTRHDKRTSRGKGPYTRNVDRPQRRRRVVQNLSDSDQDSPPSSPNRRPTTRLQTNSLPKPASAPRSTNEELHTQRILSSPTIPSDTYQENDAPSGTASNSYQQTGVPSRTASNSYQQTEAPSRTASNSSQQTGARPRTPPMARDQEEEAGGRFRPYHLPQTPNRGHLQLQPTEATVDVAAARRALTSALKVMNEQGRDPRERRENSTVSESGPSGSQTTDNVTYSTVELETNSTGNTFSDEVVNVQSDGNGSVDRSTFINDKEVCIGRISHLDTSHSIPAEANNTTGNPQEEMEISTVTITNCENAEDQVSVIDIEEDAPTANGTTNLDEEPDDLPSGMLHGITSIQGNCEKYQQRNLDTPADIEEPTINCQIISPTENGNTGTDAGGSILSVLSVEGNSDRYDKLSNLDAPMEVMSNEALDADVTNIKCRAFSPTNVDRNCSNDYSHNTDHGNTATPTGSSSQLLQEDMKPCNSSMAWQVNELLENLIVQPVLQKQEVTVTAFHATWRGTPAEVDANWQEIVTLRRHLDDMVSRERTLSFFISAIVAENEPATSFPSVGYWVVTRHPDFNKDLFVQNMKAEGQGADLRMLLKADGGNMDEAGVLVNMLKDYSNVKVQRHIAISAHKAGLDQDHPTMRVILREKFFMHLLKNAMKRLQKVALFGSLEQVM